MKSITEKKPSRPYQAPKLSNHGSVADLTHSRRGGSWGRNWSTGSGGGYQNSRVS